MRGRREIHRSLSTAHLLVAMVITPYHSVAAQTDTSAHASPNVAADVQFMQGMIAHHAQALAMVSLIPSRTRRDDMRLVGQRIGISQHDEIAMMQRWLADHHEAVPTLDAHNVAHMPGTEMDGMQMSGTPTHAMVMPGMLTEEQMAQLTHATGPEFDRLFLEGMIRHHEGALTMVATLFATPGAGQASDIFRFASDVDTDQRAEISRMRAMLDTLTRDSHR